MKESVTQAFQLRLFELRGAVVNSREWKERKWLKQLFLEVADEQKVCARCTEKMDAEQFYVDERYSDLLYPYCRECKIAIVKERNRRKAA